MRHREARPLAAKLMGAVLAESLCCRVATVRKRLQASASSAAAAPVHGYMVAEHWPANQVRFRKLCASLCNSSFVHVTLGEESALDGGVVHIDAAAANKPHVVTIHTCYNSMLGRSVRARTAM